MSNKMGWKKRLRSMLFCLVLGFGSLSGMAMCPEEIEELMANMNRPKIVHVLRQEDDAGGGSAGDRDGQC